MKERSMYTFNLKRTNAGENLVFETTERNFGTVNLDFVKFNGNFPLEKCSKNQYCLRVDLGIF